MNPFFPTTIILLCLAILLLYGHVLKTRRLLRVFIEESQKAEEAKTAFNKKTTSLLANMTEQILNQDKMITHIYVILNSFPLPVQTHMLLERGPDGIPKTPAEQRKFVNEVNMQNYRDIRERIQEALSESTKDEDKRRLSSLLEEMDGLYNLMATVDDKSSPAYFQQITNEIPITLRKILEALNGEMGP